MITKENHCDNFINDYRMPNIVRTFLILHRMPAIDKNIFKQYEQLPWLIYADYKGKRVAMTMASRMGDIGITEVLDKPLGYDNRVPITELSNFSLTK